jgi:hypothetical protein
MQDIYAFYFIHVEQLDLWLGIEMARLNDDDDDVNEVIVNVLS